MDTVIFVSQMKDTKSDIPYVESVSRRKKRGIKMIKCCVCDELSTHSPIKNDDVVTLCDKHYKGWMQGKEVLYMLIENAEEEDGSNPERNPYVTIRKMMRM